MSGQGTTRFALHCMPEGDPFATQGSATGLLRAIAGSEGLERVGCFASGQAHARDCERVLRQFGYGGQFEWIPRGRPQDLARFGTLYHPAPTIERLAWRRLGLGERRYSLCGVLSGIASHAAMSAICRLPVAPLRSWDAIVCPSRVVRDSVRVLVERQAEYLRARLGAQRFELPQLPLIPPGVHCGDLQVEADQRADARCRLGIGEDDVAFLFAGRLSCHAEAHPQQVFSALERAHKAGRQVHLILCGRSDDDATVHALRDAAAQLCPSVRLTLLDDRTPGQQADLRASAWAAADVFTALADNPHQTCGLAPLDAMAAGLPCMVSDWDGHRDTVRDGVDGYCIPTVMPGPGAGLDLAQRYDDGMDSYEMYCGHTSQAVALDGALLAQACGRLIGDAGLRRQLGENARRRAQEFDWPVVFARYRQLWDELDERRRADAALAPPRRRRARAAAAGVGTGSARSVRAVRQLSERADHAAVAGGAGAGCLAGPAAPVPRTRDQPLRRRGAADARGIRPDLRLDRIAPDAGRRTAGCARPLRSSDAAARAGLAVQDGPAAHRRDR